jgi:phosphoribosylformylglycinamidine synthase
VKAKVHVTLRPGVLDPQGKAIQNALGALGFDGVREVRQGKSIEIDLTETNHAKARSQVEAMCAKLLANPVIETYSVELTE